MIFLRAGGTGPSRPGLVGLALIAVGLLVLLSGVALLMLLAVAGLTVGGATMLVRRVLGHRPLRRPTDASAPLELEADFEILPAPRSPVTPGEPRLPPAPDSPNASPNR